MKYFVALITGIILGSSASYFGMEKAFEAIHDSIFYLLTFTVIFIFLFCLVVINHEQIIRKIISFPKSEDNQNLSNDIRLITSGSLTEHPDIIERLLKQSMFIFGKIRFTFFAHRALSILLIGLTGVFGAYLTIRQNKIMEIQSGLLKSQVDQAQLQTLQNIAMQRSVYQSQINRFLDQVNELRKDTDADAKQFNKLHKQKTSFHRLVKLSDSMVSELRKLLSRLPPYHVIRYKNSSIDDYKLNFISPERGQILEGLMKAGVDLDIVRPVLDFSYADLQGVRISFQELKTYCSLSNSEHKLNNIYSMTGVNIEYADLSGAEFENVNIDLTNVVTNDTEFTHSKVSVDLDFSDSPLSLILFATPINFESYDQHGYPTGKAIDLGGLTISTYQPGCFVSLNDIPIDKVADKHRADSMVTVPVLFSGARIGFDTGYLPLSPEKEIPETAKLIDHLLTNVLGIDKNLQLGTESGKILWAQNDVDGGNIELDFGNPRPTSFE